MSNSIPVTGLATQVGKVATESEQSPQIVCHYTTVAGSHIIIVVHMVQHIYVR
jgi:hypothetical protein